MAKFDFESIKLQIATQKSSREAIGAVMDKKAEQITQDNKKELIKNFQEHIVSQEVEQGPNGENISNTLNGKGNLFSFIGFLIGEQPIKEVSEYLDENIKLDPNSKIQGRDFKGRFKSGGSNLLFDYRIKIPSKQDVYDKTPLIWEPTRSWIQGIEQGIAGFTSYIYWKTAGRSTGGIQANDGRNANGQFNGTGKSIKLRDGKFNNIPYFSQMYNTFIKSFKGTNEL